MSFRPEDIGGAGASPAGQIDYRLVRRHTVDEFRRGRLGRRDICDAHPELLRAARGIGRPGQPHECPICDESSLVLVSFAFGANLPAHGRVVDTHKEMTKLSRRREESTCYVVEVCPECAWNHLVRAFPWAAAAPAPADTRNPAPGPNPHGSGVPASAVNRWSRAARGPASGRGDGPW